MNTDTIVQTAVSIFDRAAAAGSTFGNLVTVSPIGPFHATKSNRPGGGASHFLFRYGGEGDEIHRRWCIEYDPRTKALISMRGPIDDMDNYEQMLSELSKFRIFHG